MRSSSTLGGSVMMSQSVLGACFNVPWLLKTLRWRVSHRLQAWHRLAAFCSAAQSIAAKPFGKAFRATAAGAGAVGAGVVGEEAAAGETAATGCHTRTPMAASMARCLASKDSVIPKPSPLQAHDHRVFALVGRHRIVVFSLALQVKPMGLVQTNAGTVTGPHLKPNGMHTALA